MYVNALGFLVCCHAFVQTTDEKQIRIEEHFYNLSKLQQHQHSKRQDYHYITLDLIYLTIVVTSLVMETCGPW